MSVINTPTNKNFLSPLNFKFNIVRSPNLSFSVQQAVLPGINLAVIEQSTPFVNIPLASTRITYGELSITFKVDEDMENYREMYEWMNNIGLTKSFEDYAALQQGRKGSPSVLMSDLNLSILTSNLRPNISINFFDAFPVSLSDITLNTTDADVNYVDATVGFRYLRYEIAKP